MRRLLTVTSATVAVALVATMAVANGGTSWSTFAGDRMTFATDEVGPTDPTIQWTVTGEELGGYGQSGISSGTFGDAGFLLLDGSGHLLSVAGRDEDPDAAPAQPQFSLLALDTDDGSLAWRYPATPPTAVAAVYRGIEGGCDPAVDEDGDIWVQLPIDGADNPNRVGADVTAARFVVVEVDATDGTATGNRYSGTPATPLRGACGVGLQVAGDGTIVLREGFDAERVHGVDPSDGSQQFVVDALLNCTNLAPYLWTPPAGAPNADWVYVVGAAPDGGPGCTTGLTVYAVRTADGELRFPFDLTDAPIESISSISVGHEQATLADGSLVLTTSREGGPFDGAVRRLAGTADGMLTETWEVAIDADAADCAAELCQRPSSIAVAGDRLVARYQSRETVVAVRASDGRLVWEHDPEAVDESRQLLVDGDGTITVPLFSSTSASSKPAFITLDRDGDRLGEVSPGDTQVVATTASVGPIDAEGRLFTLSSRGNDRWTAFEQGEGPPATPTPTPEPTAEPLPPLPPDRAAGGGRDATAVEISRISFPQPDDADAVVLARQDAYPDALTGAPLARLENAPILLTQPSGLNPVVREEIERLGVDRAILLGGELALTPQVVTDLQALGVTDIERVDGGTRFDTARLIAGRLGPTAPDAYLVEGANADPARGWPDGVSAASIAALQGRPVLLATRDDVPTETREALADLDVERVTIVGGPVAVSEATETVIAGIGGIETARLFGGSRYATSVAVAEAALAAGATARVVWASTGRNWPDALAAGPAVAKGASVLLLVDPDDLDASPESGAFLTEQRGEVEQVVLTGGETAISTEVEQQIRAIVGD